MALVRPPLGIELVRRGIVTQDDITKALDYQKENPSEKLGDILYLQHAADPEKLLRSIGEILDEKVVMLSTENVKINVSDYISTDMMR